MVLVHDNDLADIHDVYDGTVSVSKRLYCKLILLTFFFLVADRASPTRCNIKSPEKRRAEDPRGFIWPR